MSQTERLYRLKSLLDSGRSLAFERLLAALGSSPATLKRDIDHLRHRMNAPVVYDRVQGFARRYQRAWLETPATGATAASRPGFDRRYCGAWLVFAAPAAGAVHPASSGKPFARPWSTSTAAEERRTHPPTKRKTDRLLRRAQGWGARPTCHRRANRLRRATKGSLNFHAPKVQAQTLLFYEQAPHRHSLYKVTS